eukprot:TRINITY_DN42851_c0_g1_i1.p1 TRINITY_DN42851_c0_g1~~TRINITY_DN42851_c0_g1_i1.p1  ORF type:complete len:640 (+),score=186.01 TRINITY_DN42851_c0_g1_i1:89-1921(+)
MQGREVSVAVTEVTEPVQGREQSAFTGDASTSALAPVRSGSGEEEEYASGLRTERPGHPASPGRRRGPPRSEAQAALRQMLRQPRARSALPPSAPSGSQQPSPQRPGRGEWAETVRRGAEAVLATAKLERARAQQQTLHSACTARRLRAAAAALRQEERERRRLDKEWVKEADLVWRLDAKAARSEVALSAVTGERERRRQHFALRSRLAAYQQRRRAADAVHAQEADACWRREALEWDAEAQRHWQRCDSLRKAQLHQDRQRLEVELAKRRSGDRRAAVRLSQGDENARRAAAHSERGMRSASAASSQRLADRQTFTTRLADAEEERYLFQLALADRRRLYEGRRADARHRDGQLRHFTCHLRSRSCELPPRQSIDGSPSARGSCAGSLPRAGSPPSAPPLPGGDPSVQSPPPYPGRSASLSRSPSPYRAATSCSAPPVRSIDSSIYRQLVGRNRAACDEAAVAAAARARRAHDAARAPPPPPALSPLVSPHSAAAPRELRSPQSAAHSAPAGRRPSVAALSPASPQGAPSYRAHSPAPLHLAGGSPNPSVAAEPGENEAFVAMAEAAGLRGAEAPLLYLRAARNPHLRRRAPSPCGSLAASLRVAFRP